MRKSSRPPGSVPPSIWLMVVIVAGIVIAGLALTVVTLGIAPGSGSGGAAQGSASAPPSPLTRAATATLAPPPTTAPATIAQTTASGEATTVAARAIESVRLATAMALAATATAAAPLAPTAQVGQVEAASRYDRELDRLLLDNGYYANIIRVGERRGLRASQRNYSNSFWTRDLDYAISGYSYALGDMGLFAENIELFLSYVTPEGVAPETIYLREGRLDAENRESWDSMPNLIHAAYVYVAKTGDRSFYANHRDRLLSIGEWIARLDSDGDGMPDRDIFPYGYYDSVENGPLHTYALARFYGAYLELAELEAALGLDDSQWRERALRLRTGFHRPLAEGGYWIESQPWPIAWKRADGRVVPMLETFGVLSALRSGLIAPADERYADLIAALHTNLPALLDGPAPFKLSLGGYEPAMRRVVDPPVPLWMLDASAPWIVGLAAPAYAAAGYPEDARAIVEAYARMARETSPPVVEFTAGANARYGPGDSNDRGRTWDSAAWFLAVYGGHYGLTMTPAALIVQPWPYADLPDDQVVGLSYQGARINLRLAAAEATYHIEADRPALVVLRPMAGGKQMRLDGGAPQAELRLLLEPGRSYTITTAAGEE